MRRTVVRALALLVMTLTVVATPPAHADDPVRILVYGDSITHGSSGDWTWRYRLWRHLSDVGANVDFVGPRHGVLRLPDKRDGAEDETYAGGSFDSDSGAVWGQALTLPTYDLANATGDADLVTDYRPDVVVALIGFNDMRFRGLTPQALTDVWRDKISAARAARSDVDIVLVQQPDVWFPGFDAYNADLVALASELDTPSSRVVTTEPIGLARDVDTYDGIHPSATGEIRIARAVEDALARIGVGAPAGMWPVVANGPAHASMLWATPGVEQVALRWQAVPGVTLEWLERRDATAGERWVRYPYPLDADVLSWTATGLVDGHRYEFRLRPAKGTAISEVLTSPVVSMVPGQRPGAPRLTSTSADAGGRLTLSWVASAGAASYVVGLRDATLAGSWRWVARTSARSARLTGLLNGHRYETRVRADDGLIEGGTSAVAAVAVPLLGPVTAARARSPRRHRVRTTAATVPFATGYRLLAARTRSCKRPPRAGGFHTASGDLTRPVATIRATSRALWVRWYAVRDGVVGRLAVASTACTRVR